MNCSVVCFNYFHRNGNERSRMLLVLYSTQVTARMIMSSSNTVRPFWPNKRNTKPIETNYSTNYLWFYIYVWCLCVGVCGVLPIKVLPYFQFVCSVCVCLYLRSIGILVMKSAVKLCWRYKVMSGEKCDTMSAQKYNNRNKNKRLKRQTKI